MKGKKIKAGISRYSILIWILFALWGCEKQNSSETDSGEGGRNLYEAYVAINLHMLEESEVRSNPTGGEDGDGKEPGLDNENAIKNLTVLFYPGNDINSSLNTPVEYILYVDETDIIGTTTRVQKIQLDRAIYHLIVIANAGDLSLDLYGKTVQEVCDYIQHNAWTLTGGNYSDFIMTSAADESIDLITKTSENNPATATVEIQRIAARIDIIPNAGDNATNTYSIVENGETLAQVTVRKGKLVNRLTAGSYLIKRTASTVGGTPVYMGNETPASGVQTNYVIDPWTAIKTKANLSGGHFNLVEGGSGTDVASGLYANYFDSSFSLGAEDALQQPISGKDFYILDYTLENTMYKDNQVNGYSTGITYETVYLPLKITNYNASSIKNEIINNTDVITFFATTENLVVYNSLEAIAAVSLAPNQPDDFFSHTFTTANTWGELQEYMQRLSDNDRLGFKAYLEILLLDKTLTNHLTQEVSWKQFILSNYGFSQNGNTITINQNGLDTKQVFNQQGIKMYEEGLCYYTYWIRHSNDNTIDSAIMEFAIVRNNIYKLQIVSFSALGKPEPFNPGTDDPENPDEESYITLVITVKPWRLRTHPEIIL